MLGSIIGVVIGLSFVYLFLSLITTWIQELVATLLRWRSKELTNAIQNLLDPSTEKLDGVKKLESEWKQGAGIIAHVKENLVKSFYEQPGIQGLKRPTKLPGYIPPREFSTTLYSLISKAGTEASPALHGIEAFKRGIAEIENPVTKGVLESLVSIVEEKQAKVEEKISDLREHIAEWFDAAMDRASGWYKRKAQQLAIAVGLLIAAAFNVNTFEVVDSLWTDESLRERMEKVAVEYADAPEKKSLSDLFGIIEDMPLPIGWAKENLPSDWNWLLHILGWIVTGFAISQGSPIWFDVLNRFISIRGSGKKPAASNGTD